MERDLIGELDLLHCAAQLAMALLEQLPGVMRERALPAGSEQIGRPVQPGRLLDGGLDRGDARLERVALRQRLAAGGERALDEQAQRRMLRHRLAQLADRAGEEHVPFADAAVALRRGTEPVA